MEDIFSLVLTYLITPRVVVNATSNVMYITYTLSVKMLVLALLKVGGSIQR